jgi:hypothetical protein
MAHCCKYLTTNEEVYSRQTRKKWSLDANAVAQEKGIEAVLAIGQYSGESSSR